MSNNWMIRSGGRGAEIELFENGFVAIGWSELGDISQLKNRDELLKRYKDYFKNHKPAPTGIAVAMLDRFINIMQEGDGVITYDPIKRVYFLGKIAGPCIYNPKVSAYLPLQRKVKWETKEISRDSLRALTRFSLGSVLTVFKLRDEVWADLIAVMKGENTEDPTEPEEKIAEEAGVKKSFQEQAKEALKDRIVKLDEEDMEQLLAALLRALGFRATVNPKGPDRGVDVIASPDGLGLQEPRIKGEVKHRRNTIGAPEIRSFIGGLRSGDKGVYLSIGGFTKEAHYEAERSNIPVTLLDLDTLANLIEANYEQFDNEGRALLPLTRIYWPAD